LCAEILEVTGVAVIPQPWPVLTPAALELGVRAVFAVPRQIGAIRRSVLLAHRDVPGLMNARACLQPVSATGGCGVGTL
jgi:hypothetical protein